MCIPGFVLGELWKRRRRHATETGRAWLDAGGPSLAQILFLEQREAGGWGGGENSSSQRVSACLRPETFTQLLSLARATLRAARTGGRRLLGGRKLHHGVGQIVEAASFPHLHPSTECALF